MARFDRVPIRNFSRVSGTVFRGAEPGAEGLQFVRSLGIRTVIDLRKAGDGPTQEFDDAVLYQLNYFNINTGYLQVPDHVVAAFLAVTLHPNYQPIFVHCNDGIDRTGALIALYLIAVEGWPLEWALDELEMHSFRPWQLFLKRTVRRFGEKMNALNFQQRLSAVQELVESNLFTVP
jgi:tyrosine-protein phosphatase SIW14